jgi:hypothetical protein
LIAYICVLACVDAAKDTIMLQQKEESRVQPFPKVLWA